MRKIPLVLAGVAAAVTPVVLAAPGPEPAMPDGPLADLCAPSTTLLLRAGRPGRRVGSLSMKQPNSCTGCTPTTRVGTSGSAPRPR